MARCRSVLTTAPPLTGLRPSAERVKEKSRILWADDNADMRAYVRRLLGDRFDVEAVPDGKAALDAARARKPDLVLTDVMMPGLDGFGLLRELRADPQLCEIPVILLSARAGEEARIEGLQAGADDYLIKPFSPRELLALVESHVKMSRFRHEATEAARRADRNASLLASIVESSDDAIVSKNLDGVIMSWNQGARTPVRLHGGRSHRQVDQHFDTARPYRGGTANSRPAPARRARRPFRNDSRAQRRIAPQRLADDFTGEGCPRTGCRRLENSA